MGVNFLRLIMESVKAREKVIERKLETYKKAKTGPILLRIFMWNFSFPKENPFSFPVKSGERGFSQQSYILIFRSNFVCRYFLRSFFIFVGESFIPLYKESPKNSASRLDEKRLEGDFKIHNTSQELRKLIQLKLIICFSSEDVTE